MCFLGKNKQVFPAEPKRPFIQIDPGIPTALDEREQNQSSREAKSFCESGFLKI